MLTASTQAVAVDGKLSVQVWQARNVIMTIIQSQVIFWPSMIIAQLGAFIIFKDLADISQWVVQSTRTFTMNIWYHRYLIGAVSVAALVIALIVWWREPSVCPK